MNRTNSILANDLKISQSNIIDNINKINNSDIYNYILNNSCNEINYFWLGRRDYHYIWDLQRNIQHNIKSNNMNNVILFLEHDPIYTLGRNTDSSNVLPTKSPDMPVVKTDRGGDVTYHGPGQLVGYPIVDLKKYRRSITWFMRGLEDSIIRMLDSINIPSTTKEGLTGVWVQDKKIAALGVRLSRWVSMHGFAINVSTNMTNFNGIIPCGISDFGLTSIHKLKTEQYSLIEIASRMSNTLSDFFEKSREAEINHA